MNPITLLTSFINYVKNTATGKLILGIILLVLFLLILLPLFRKLRRRQIKEKETREIMKDLFTWRHLAQLVKGGGDHEKAKQELSDNLVKINDLLKQGLKKFIPHERALYANPWFVLLGEPRSGKSSLLESSDLEFRSSAVEKDASDDGKNSLPVRLWSGTSAVVCDISGRVFFDRWLDGSSAEWNYIIKQICRIRRKWPLDGIIITIPADALLVDDDNLTSHKAILMANELSSLLQNCGMFLPCYVVITKLDMVNGFHEYAEFIRGDLRHQILGFENTTKWYNQEKFDEFWQLLNERLTSGAKQLIAENTRRYASHPEARMDTAAKIWTFADTLNGMGENIKTYLNALFSADNYHGTGYTSFEGIYLTSAKDMFISLSPVMAGLGGLSPEELVIPGNTPETNDTAPVKQGGDHSLMLLPSRQTALIQSIGQFNWNHSYFIRDVFHTRILRKSERTSLTRKKALMLHLPHYLLCAAFVGAGMFWGLTAWFNRDRLKNDLSRTSSYYTYLDGILQKGIPFASPLIKEDPPGRFAINMDPVATESLSSRVQFFYNAVVSRDMSVPIPGGFGLARLLTDGIQPNFRYQEKAFIVNQLYATMIRMPIIRNVGNKIIRNVDTQVLTSDTKAVLTSFLELDEVINREFNRFFRSGHFRLDRMLRYLVPEVSNDTVDLLSQYKARYERDYSYSVDVDYIYSNDFTRAKEAALNTIISAWDRYAVYPDSLYGQITRLAAISDEIITNYSQIGEVLRRVNTVVTLDQVRSIVYEWQGLTNRHKSLTAEGRAIFAEIREQLRAAHIPLGFDTILSTVSAAAATAGSGGIALNRQTPDAYGDNLINNYLFNDMIFEFAIREYTALFDADMAFVRQKLDSSDQERLGRVIALQGAFGNRLNQELANLRSRVARLQDNELLADKVDESPNGASIFSVVEQILNLSSDIALPGEQFLYTAGFEQNWQENQSNIKTAMDEYDVYTKDYLENKKIGTLTVNARNMLLAQSYLNRYIVFTTTLNFLYSFEANIAGIVASQAGKESAITFSDTALEGVMGITSYNRSYDPGVVKRLVDNITAFASLFTVQNPVEELPAFLQNVPPSVYKPEAFLRYVENYIRYWSRYPDSVYAPENSWVNYRNRLQTIKPFQINTVLRVLYTKSIDALNVIDPSILNQNLIAARDQYIATLNDKANIVSDFLSTDAERMIAAWINLPEEPLTAFKALQSVPEEELQETYLSVYTGDPALTIGWWNDLTMDGIQVLSGEFRRETTAAFMSRRELLKQYPLCTDASPASPLTINNMRDIAFLLNSMGAGGSLEEEQGAIKQALYPVLFKGAAVPWVRRIYQVTQAVSDEAKPLTWTIAQPPIDMQNKLPLNGRLLAANRFRYIEVKSENNTAERFSTYMNQKINLASGYPEEGTITLRFFKTSEDRTPQVTVTIDHKWAIFNLYFQQDTVQGTDTEGSLYTPLYLSADGNQYVYFVELSFNREIPSPGEWNTLRTSPDLVIQDGSIAGSRLQF
ncbi:MAG: hypothetical protein LBC60_05575 [Spirochaetaceae bacterium]|jgi:hypothetical protein|nr:hypothetical protein [Spirochaetaceae bacterium]